MYINSSHFFYIVHSKVVRGLAPSGPRGPSTSSLCLRTHTPPWLGWHSAKPVAITHGNSVGSWWSRWRTGHSCRRWSSPYRNIDQWSPHRYRLWTGIRTHKLHENTHTHTHVQSWPYTLSCILNRRSPTWAGQWRFDGVVRWPVVGRHAALTVYPRCVMLKV